MSVSLSGGYILVLRVYGQSVKKLGEVPDIASSQARNKCTRSGSDQSVRLQFHRGGSGPAQGEALSTFSI